MTHIDTATGLPKLPKDHIWDIQAHEIKIIGPWTKWETMPTGDYAVVANVASVLSEMEERREVPSVRKVLKRTLVREAGIFRDAEWKEEWVEDESKVSEYRHRHLIASKQWGTYTDDEYIGHDIEEQYLGYPFYFTKKFLVPVKKTHRVLKNTSPVTPQNVIQRCEEVLKTLRNQQIYGTYPPKKFESEEEK